MVLRASYYFLAFSAAFVGLTSELIQTHVLTIIWGGLITQLTLVFATYVFAMGLGAACAKPQKSPQMQFIFLQFVLFTLGAVIPIILIYMEYHLPTALSAPLAYGLVFLLGFLFGFELPLLYEISTTLGLKEQSFEKLMVFDYFGMAAACVIFSTFMIRELGLWNTLFFNCSLNLLNGLIVLVLFRKAIQRRFLIFISLSFMLLILANSMAFTRAGLISTLASKWVTG